MTLINLLMIILSMIQISTNKQLLIVICASRIWLLAVFLACGV